MLCCVGSPKFVLSCFAGLIRLWNHKFNCNSKAFVGLTSIIRFHSVYFHFIHFIFLHVSMWKLYIKSNYLYIVLQLIVTLYYIYIYIVQSSQFSFCGLISSWNKSFGSDLSFYKSSYRKYNKPFEQNYGPNKSKYVLTYEWVHIHFQIIEK